MRWRWHECGVVALVVTNRSFATFRVGPISITRSRQERVGVAIDRTPTHDLASVVDGRAELQIPAGVLWYESVEVEQLVVMKENGAHVERCPVYRETHGVALVVQGVTARMPVKIAPGKVPRSCMPACLFHRKGWMVPSVKSEALSRRARGSGQACGRLAQRYAKPCWE